MVNHILKCSTGEAHFKLWLGVKGEGTRYKLCIKAGYTATLVACGWAGAALEMVTRASGQELYAQKAQKR